ncbi:hypothetical protein F2Q70_00005918 [Brassica cretica]|uniref:NOT2/NOT3/NOT5 C-terminal domain-containing protein n=1 Tax=Brassica cretica TaxID=69181 RepID=A0A8S9IT59_BRACR|nr:hypothetical protein F2Q70_00005918 [Brassica cretica]
MERFKICEKETKTKAFSKEGLGQQPKTDPKEKAKSETRDWLNNVVSELESQIDSFEAELEGLSVKKGKTRPPRLTHLETSISRHKDHIIKLELILRLLDNDELSPEQVNDVKDFLDDYVERNQDDFDEFSDVDELYSTLPLDEVEGLEDLVTAGPLVKVRGRTEIAPDQREKFLQRYQQVHHGNLLGMPSLSGGNEMQFSSQQQNPLLQQSSAMSPHMSPHGSMGLQAPGFSVMSSASLQQPSNAMTQQLGQQPSVADVDHGRNDDQLQQNLPDDSSSLAASKTVPNEDDSKGLFDTPSGMPSYMLDQVQVTRDGPDFSPGQPIQPGQSSSSLGVIGRRSNSELGSIGDPSALGPMHDQMYNLQMLEAAYYRLPQPKDSERPRPYTPRNPAITPQTFPQTQAPIVNNPLFWERLGSDAYGTETLFFAFYYQQNSYQQYLAAKELKKQSWRYHRKFNTWFQRHKEPKIATDEYEQGAYVYFDFQTPKDESQEGGWVQRIKNEFTFEYSYLEDELAV